MMQCWQWTPSKRPAFGSLETMLKEHHNSYSNATYVNLHVVVPNLEEEGDACSAISEKQPADISTCFVVENENRVE